MKRALVPSQRIAVSGDPLENLLAAAQAHGAESDPDHEVGDLQEILRSCWDVMLPTQRREVYHRHAELIESWFTP